MQPTHDLLHLVLGLLAQRHDNADLIGIQRLQGGQLRVQQVLGMKWSSLALSRSAIISLFLADGRRRLGTPELVPVGLAQ